MSRFLDRMIAGARGPVSNVRPVVRPLFLETERPDAPVEESREVSSPAPVPRVFAQTPVASVAKAGLLSEHPPIFPRKPVPEPEAAAAPEREAYRPLILETHHVERLAEHPTDGIRIEASPHAPAEMPAALADARPPTAAGASIRAPFAEGSKLSERLVRTETRPVSQPVQRISPAPKPSVNAQDRIEIQIGRIEITAAPPQAPSLTPPRRPRSSVSLTDYLKRGERV